MIHNDKCAHKSLQMFASKNLIRTIQLYVIKFIEIHSHDIINI